MAIGLPKVVLSSPIRFDISAIRLFIEDVLDVSAAEVVKDFESTTKTWQEHHPVFSVEKRPYFRRVTTADPIYAYLNFGTSERHALMSNPFVPKTQPGVIGSNAGVGSVVRVSKLLNLPGIKARRFDGEIQKRQQKLMVARVAKGIVQATLKRI